MPFDLTTFCEKYPTHPLCQPVQIANESTEEEESYPIEPEQIGTATGENSAETGDEGTEVPEPNQGNGEQPETGSTLEISEHLREWGLLRDGFGAERIQNLRQMAVDAGHMNLVGAIDRVLGE